MTFYICSKLFYHAHNFECILQWALHNPNINWLCYSVTLERKIKTKILSISSNERIPRFTNIFVSLLRHGKNINRHRLFLYAIFYFFSSACFKQATFFAPTEYLEHFINIKVTLAYHFYHLPS